MLASVLIRCYLPFVDVEFRLEQLQKLWSLFGRTLLFAVWPARHRLPPIVRNRFS